MERRAREKDLAKLEATILRLETKQKELATQLEHPDLYDDASKPLALHRELSSVTVELEMANAAWNNAADALSTLANAKTSPIAAPHATRATSDRRGNPDPSREKIACQMKEDRR